MPYKVCASLLAVSNSVDLEATIECDAYSFIVMCFDLLKIFGAKVNIVTQKVEVQYPVQNTRALRANVDQFIEKYKFLDVSVHQLRTYLQSLVEDEHIIFHWGLPPTREEGLPLFSLLYSLEKGGYPGGFKEIYNCLFAGFVAKYDVISFHSSERKRNVGEHDKKKRVCRFCNNKRDDITFKNKAHAISESLGNKNIILNEECDKCNLEFGTGIERDLINYLKPYACIFGIKGKNGIPIYKGRNFKLSRNEDGGLDLNYYLNSGEEKCKSRVILKTYDSITMQNIYRTLCKYALSVIDRKYLERYEEALVWIKGEKNVEKLPPIAILKSYKLVTAQPQITISIRTESDNELPFAVGEFRCTYLTFVFIIPLSGEDKKTFVEEKDYQTFWKFFKHYSSINEWVFTDFSDKKKKDHVLQLNIKSSNDYSIQHL
jgi:hypothetical protein